MLSEKIQILGEFASDRSRTGKEPSAVVQPKHSVLIVDDSEESREVLRTVLERKGMQIWEATEARQGLQLARKHRPDVIVLDAEAEYADDQRIYDGYGAQSRDFHSSLVILGSLQIRKKGTSSDQMVSKPYHFGPLIRTIEKLAARSHRRARLKNSSESPLPA